MCSHTFNQLAAAINRAATQAETATLRGDEGFRTWHQIVGRDISRPNEPTNDSPENCLIAALLARSRAYEFAVTHHWGHKIDKEELAEKAVADVDCRQAGTPASRSGAVTAPARQRK